MQKAIAARADERHLWIQVALLWQFLDHANDVKATAPRQDAPTCRA